jgi:putative phosphoesterase
MRVAALYDIHGNLPALEAVLADVRAAEADLVVVGGDVVPGPMPREVIGTLLDLDTPVQFVKGNCDRDLVALRAGGEAQHLPESVRATMRWTADQIDDDMARTMAAWPATTHLHMSSLGHVLFCHATPRNDTEIFTRLTPDERLFPIFEPAHAAVVVCGHTHMQFDRTVGTTRVVNAGSVGMPFQEPGAYWLLLGPDVELRRTEYPLDRAAERIRATSYPQAAEFAERNVLHPPSERETLESFSRVELG